MAGGTAEGTALGVAAGVPWGFTAPSPLPEVCGGSVPDSGVEDDDGGAAARAPGVALVVGAAVGVAVGVEPVLSFAQPLEVWTLIAACSPTRKSG